MLIEFRVENHRSVRDEQVLTMEAGRVGDKSDPRARQVNGAPKPLLTAAALYGANASGKSNVLAALGFMRRTVLYSQRFWAPEEGVPRDPFAWGKDPGEPSLFEVTFVLDGVRFAYGFVATDEAFVEEWLFAWPKGRKQVWFERDEATFKFGEHLGGQNQLVAEATRDNALFFSTAAQLGHKRLTKVYGWFRSLAVLGPDHRDRRRTRAGLLVARAFDGEGEGKQGNLFDDELPAEGPDSRGNAYRTFLRAADLGIVDVKLVDEADDGDGSGLGDGDGRRGPRRRPSRRRVFLRHSSTADAAEQRWLPLEQESEGTQTLFRMAPMIINVLERGSVLVVDELEASLHPLLALHLIRQFNDPETNPRNAQLVFTTHDTNLLGTALGDPVLRRDQIWLTEKDDEGATTLSPLSDYKPRKVENLERGYLQGRYGGIPFLGPLAPSAE